MVGDLVYVKNWVVSKNQMTPINAQVEASILEGGDVMKDMF